MCEDWIQEVLGLDFTVWNVSYWKHRMTFLMSWTRGAPAPRPRAARPPASLPERPAHRSRAAFAVFYTVCGLEMNVLWALTFLGQCGVCGLDLMLTWEGGRAAADTGRSVVRGEARRLLGKIMSKGVRLPWSCRIGRIQARKTGLKQTALSRVPWWEDQCKS